MPPPQEYQVLIPETCQYCLVGKEGFTDVIKDLKMGRLFWVI